MKPLLDLEDRDKYSLQTPSPEIHSNKN